MIPPRYVLRGSRHSFFSSFGSSLGGGWGIVKRDGNVDENENDSGLEDGIKLVQTIGNIRDHSGIASHQHSQDRTRDVYEPAAVPSEREEGPDETFTRVEVEQKGA